MPATPEQLASNRIHFHGTQETFCAETAHVIGKIIGPYKGATRTDLPREPEHTQMDQRLIRSHGNVIGGRKRSAASRHHEHAVAHGDDKRRRHQEHRNIEETALQEPGSGVEMGHVQGEGDGTVLSKEGRAQKRRLQLRKGRQQLSQKRQVARSRRRTKKRRETWRQYRKSSKLKSRNWKDN